LNHGGRETWRVTEREGHKDAKAPRGKRGEGEKEDG